MAKYKAVLFAPDGDWVTDFRESETIEEVQESLCNMGSRWYFYPFHAVIVDHGALTTEKQRCVSVAEPFEYLHGYAIKNVAKFIATTPEEQLRAILEG